MKRRPASATCASTSAARDLLASSSVIELKSFTQRREGTQARETETAAVASCQLPANRKNSSRSFTDNWQLITGNFAIFA